LLLVFIFLPASMLHFAQVFPERAGRPGWAAAIPYMVSAVLAVPYLLLFRSRPQAWAMIEAAVVIYLAGAYVFWMVKLAATLKSPRSESDRLLARSLLRGQLVGFSVPFLAAVAIFVLHIPVPLNLAAPVILIFPAAVFAGGLLARLHESQMRLVASERMASVGTMMAGLAHELKNPLNFVVANLDALKEKAKEPGVKEIVDDMEEGAERMRTILDDFRFFLGPERKGKIPVDLNEVVRHAVNLLRPRCEERVSLTLLLNEIPKVSGDAGALGQAALNLIANAIESISGEGEVAVTTGKRDRSVFLSVRDNGFGIPPENLKRIFDPFFTTKPQGQGTGLGLALTERIIREHGGRIEVRSEMGKGSEFELSFKSIST
jgi:signal transduction histidine kinase